MAICGVIGITERILYVSALLADYGEFIGAWLFLKIAIPYFRWTGVDEKVGKKTNGKEKEMGTEKGRSRFINTVIGNGLSIMYAAVGYGMVKWFNSRWDLFFIVPVLLALGSTILWWWLKRDVKTP